MRKTTKSPGEKIVRDTKRATRKHYSSEEKIRIVLDRAVAEINHLAGCRMGYVPIKKGRKITSVKLTWGRKDLPELIEAQKELDRPRVGRTVRREGKAETIADERAALAASKA